MPGIPKGNGLVGARLQRLCCAAKRALVLCRQNLQDHLSSLLSQDASLVILQFPVFLPFFKRQLTSVQSSSKNSLLFWGMAKLLSSSAKLIICLGKFKGWVCWFRGIVVLRNMFCSYEEIISCHKWWFGRQKGPISLNKLWATKICDWLNSVVSNIFLREKHELRWK